MNNSYRQELAQETVRILEQEGYNTPAGHYRSLASELHDCIQHTCCYSPDELDALQEQVRARPARFSRTTWEVRNETTMQAAARLAHSGDYSRVGALNFASARNPGGGFLRGAQAQEECLARSSALYVSLLRCPAYYEFHRSHPSCLYSDRMIYSPGCPVFRTDEGHLLEEAYLVDFITSPAPNAGAVRRNEPENVERINGVLRERSRKLLALAAFHKCEALVLGAWGCGVFQNDPTEVAKAFREHLAPGAAFWGRFQHIAFAVLDRTREQATVRAFEREFDGARA